jgi:uncharacterized protein YoxC
MFKKRMDRFSRRVTNWLGSPQSLLIHTVLFSATFFIGSLGIVNPDRVIAVATNLLSVEAIYLAIFIQMTVNKHSEDLEGVSEDIEEIQEDVGELQEDVEDIQKDVEEISEDVEDISEDVGELQEDVEEMSEDGEETNLSRFEYMEHTLQALLREIHDLKQKNIAHHQAQHPHPPTDSKPDTSTKETK